MLGPELFDSISTDQAIVVVCRWCLVERWVSAVHRKQDGTKREQVRIVPLVRLPGKHFRSHVAWSTDYGMRESGSITSLQFASEAEIYNFDAVVGVEQDIFGLKITMWETKCIDMQQALEHLSSVVFDYWLFESSTIHDVIK